MNTSNTSKKGAPPVVTANPFRARFAMYLTSPVIKLRVGEQHVEYNAHRDILFKLPHFRDLEGKPETILGDFFDIPSEDPEAFLILLEWLYTAQYTYDNRKLPEVTFRKRWGATGMPETCLEGLFHLRVYVVAIKYKCLLLEQEAKTRYLNTYTRDCNLRNSLHILNAACATTPRDLIDRLLLKPSDPNVVSRVGGTKQWLRALFEETKEEAWVILKDYPALTTSLLRTITLEQEE